MLIGNCIRCGSVPQLTLDMGKFGLVPLCTVCWTGLASCMEKDINLWKKTDDWMLEFHKARILKEKIEEDIIQQQEEIESAVEKTRAEKAIELLNILHDYTFDA